MYRTSVSRRTSHRRWTFAFMRPGMTNLPVASRMLALGVTPKSARRPMAVILPPSMRTQSLSIAPFATPSMIVAPTTSSDMLEPRCQADSDGSGLDHGRASQSLKRQCRELATLIEQVVDIQLGFSSPEQEAGSDIDRGIGWKPILSERRSGIVTGHAVRDVSSREAYGGSEAIFHHSVVRTYRRTEPRHVWEPLAFRRPDVRVRFGHRCVLVGQGTADSQAAGRPSGETRFGAPDGRPS